MILLLPLNRFQPNVPARGLALLIIGISFAPCWGDPISAADAPPAAALRLIVGWDDAVICCGPGTMAGMDSPEAVELFCRRQNPRGDGPAFDNLRITRGTVGKQR